MKNLTSGSEVIHKEVVIIGNGPSGLSLSAMLSGLTPHLVSHLHPDEMLSARLAHSGADTTTRSLAQLQPLLAQLAAGLEGRTTNPISLLLDALEHPCADLGMEMASLVQWRRNEDCEVDIDTACNGPSGLSLSAMLSGLTPHLVSHLHPDEMLSARLAHSGADTTTRSLAQLQPLLAQLAAGLEGRTTNPISLLLDALEHPCADLGMEMASLVQWRRNEDCEIDHVVLGKGPPGGSWHTMDPNVLTLSLGSWMALPGLAYTPSPSDTASADSQRRASAGAVARYYEHYVQQLHLGQYLHTGVNVLSVEQAQPSPPAQTTTIKKKNTKCDEIPRRKCSFVNALNFIKSRTKCHKQKPKDQTCVVRCKRPRDITKHDSPNRKVRELIDKSYFSVDQSLYFSRISRENLSDCDSSLKLSDDVIFCDPEHFICDVYSPKNKTFYGERNKFRSLSFSCDSDNCDKTVTNLENQKHNSLINISDCRLCNCFQDNVPTEDLDIEMEILCECVDETTENNARFLVRALDSVGRSVTYTCNNLVLANGASDLPNRLGLSAETYDLPWVLHDLRTLEDKLDDFVKHMGDFPDPVLVVGAGLSAADAVIATRFRSIPVLHVFRNRSVALDKQLPENMYPEYHKVHQMMLDGGSTYPLYTSLPEHAVTDISADKHVTIVSKTGVPTRHKVSFAVILIGSRPNLTFLPQEWSLGVNKNLPVDAKTNPVDINAFTHAVTGFEGLYAIGPLAGDNFVRFIPGGALAVTSDLYNKKDW